MLLPISVVPVAPTALDVPIWKISIAPAPTDPIVKSATAPLVPDPIAPSNVILALPALIIKFSASVLVASIFP